ncbi:ankyrin-1-like [Artemia franciscana]|uniref:ankyrin-1-like n=1 Tax=Artemia franciscana TaxID=6661 RepID=UPI0032D9E28A
MACNNLETTWLLVYEDKAEMHRIMVLRWSEGYVLLRGALFNRQIEIAKLLLNYGCKVNSKNIIPSDSPLHLAVVSSDTEVVEMILDKGARINAVDKLGETPLHCAIKNSDKNVEMTKLLLKHGSNVKVRTNYGRSPLHLAASRKCPQTVDYLLMHGADVNVIEYNGASPLHLAVLENALKLLIIFSNMEPMLISMLAYDGNCV